MIVLSCFDRWQLTILRDAKKLWACRNLVNSGDDIDGDFMTDIDQFSHKYSRNPRLVIEHRLDQNLFAQ